VAVQLHAERVEAEGGEEVPSHLGP
jgi:hypothetical protein